MRELRILASLAASLMLLVIAQTLGGSATVLAGHAPGVAVSPASRTVSPGGTTTVDVVVTLPANGLASWGIDIAYDQTVITATACTTPQPPPSGATNECNKAFAANKVRVGGFHASALTGSSPVTLATITFQAIGTADASSPLTVQTVTFQSPTGAVSSANHDGSVTIANPLALPLRFEPDPATVILGQNTVDVRVMLEAGSQLIDAAQLGIGFDPAHLEMVDADGNAGNGVQVAAGPAFGQVLLNAVNADSGVIQFGAGRTTVQSPPSGSILLATIKVRGRVAGDWPLTFNSAEVESAFSGNRLPVALDHGMVRVLARRLAFTSQPIRAASGFSFGAAPVIAIQDGQGVTVADDSSTVVTLNIKQGTGAATAPLTCAQTSGGVTSREAAAGVAQFAECAINLSGAGYVLEATAPDLEPVFSAPFNVTLAGDTEGDCRVSAVDYSLVVTHFGKVAGDGGWTDASPPAYRADLNGDGRVSSVDFSIVVSRFNTTAAACAAPSNGANVGVSDTAFRPASLSIPVGGTVVWLNTGTASHTVTSDTGAWAAGALPPGQAFSLTFTAPGTYAYHCALHPDMTGIITVLGP